MVSMMSDIVINPGGRHLSQQLPHHSGCMPALSVCLGSGPSSASNFSFLVILYPDSSMIWFPAIHLGDLE